MPETRQKRQPRSQTVEPQKEKAKTAKKRVGPVSGGPERSAEDESQRPVGRLDEAGSLGDGDAIVLTEELSVVCNSQVRLA